MPGSFHLSVDAAQKDGDYSGVCIYETLPDNTVKVWYLSTSKDNTITLDKSEYRDIKKAGVVER